MTHFDDVYQAALAGDKARLINLQSVNNIDAGFSTDLGATTPAFKLAKEGHHDAVELLRTLGARVHLIAEGYAIGGHHSYVETYRKKYHAYVDFIARGYAIGGHHEQVEQYRTTRKANVLSIAMGYAIAGHHAQVEIYRRDHQVNVHAIAQSYATGGHHQQVEVYRREHGANVDRIALGYAMGGYDSEVNTYRTTHSACIDSIAGGYAIAKNLQKTREFLALLPKVAPEPVRPDVKRRRIGDEQRQPVVSTSAATVGDNNLQQIVRQNSMLTEAVDVLTRLTTQNSVLLRALGQQLTQQQKCIEILTDQVKHFSTQRRDSVSRTTASTSQTTARVAASQSTTFFREGNGANQTATGDNRLSNTSKIQP